MAKETDEPGQVVITDPRAIRALAHPARLALIDALGDGEERTATECASVTGLSPSATSYHLKALAKWGIVERGDARPDGRDRPWRSAGRVVRIESSSAAATAVPELAILTTFLERDRQVVERYFLGIAEEPAAWRDSVELADGNYWMTLDELAEVASGIRDVLAPYVHRSPGERPEGSRRVRIARLTVPNDPA